MRTFVSIIILSVIFLLLGCRGSHKPNSAESLRVNELNDSITKHSTNQAIVKVAAYLIYDDGTISSFDVLNDKTIALWNTIIGSGDALKPSNNTRVNIFGNLDSLNVRIKNGIKLILDTNIVHPIKEFEYSIKNTGCEEIYITVVKNKNVLYNDTIPFHCGE